ncbi:carbohydrate ABC transporter permease [Microbacterium sp. 179-I 3D3 NHS]|uniref:carbohydrate ABC transporter permease n=1 Tax=Microbacterium sp. 179-I 3D3 NHS TaxID=3142382 RepID=UPI0039A13750
MVLLIVAPIAIYETVFVIAPIVQGALMSFQDIRLGASSGEFVGFAQYERLVSDPNFFNSLGVTLVFALSVVVFAVGMGLGTALLVNRPFRGRGAVRGLMTAPWAFPEIATVLVFIWIFNPSFGIINLIAPWAQGAGGWLTSSPLSLVSIIIIATWKNFPFYSIVILAALQSVPDDLHEAAIVDGANGWQRFRHVTLPAITPTLALLALLAFIFSFKQFALIWLTTGGGPSRSTETLVISIYNTAFKFFDYSYGAAIGVTCLLVTIVATALYALVQRRVDRMEG